MTIFDEISTDLQSGKAKNVQVLVEKALDEGHSPQEILKNGLMAGMNIVGEKFKRNEVYVPEVLVAARAMNAGINVLKPHMVEGSVEKVGKVVIGTVEGDLHDIGKNLVRIMMEAAGFEVFDLGSDVSAEKFVSKVKETGAQVVAMSALLTTTMTNMEKVVKAIEEEGLRDKVVIMVGGAPVTENFAKSIGADLYAPNATSAAQAAKARITA